MTTRAAIVEAFLGRLRTISRSTAGFETNAGQCIFVGMAPALGPDDPPVALALVLGETTAVGPSRGEHVAEQLPLVVAVVARVKDGFDYLEAWRLVEAGLGDVKQAIELDDRTLGGLVPGELVRGATETLEREDGSLSVGASITYVASYFTSWGQR